LYGTISVDMDKQSGSFHNTITIRDYPNVSYRIYVLFTYLARAGTWSIFGRLELGEAGRLFDMLWDYIAAWPTGV